MSRCGVANYLPKNLGTLERQNAYWREICAKAEHPHINRASSEVSHSALFSDVRSPLGHFYKPKVDSLSRFFDGAAGKSSYLYGSGAMSDFHRYCLHSHPAGRLLVRSESTPASARSHCM